MTRKLAWFAIVGQIVFSAGWLIAGAIEGHGYSVARHDISDLAALTAHASWMMLAGQIICAVATILFALLVLRPALRAPGHHEALGPYLVALALVGLDNLSDTFFRLDCRAADAGCKASVAAASWHG